ncbi:MAG: hypothetical protein AAF655_21060 [Bacteroidota bacterium]
MRRSICIGLFLFLISAIYASNDPIPRAGARALSLGNAYVGVRSDYWSLYYNPASIATISGLGMGAYVEQRFLLEELNYGSAGVVIPIFERQAVGLEASSFGFSAYRESRAALSYGISFLNNFSIGAKVNYATLDISEQGSTEAIYVDVGVNTALSDELSLGFAAYNVNQAQIETATGFKEDIPTVFSAGLAFTPNEKVLLVADLQKDIDHPISFRGGIEYAFASVLMARVGVSNEPLTASGGVGVNHNGLNLDFAVSYQKELGYTPHVSLSYTFGQQGE